MSIRKFISQSFAPYVGSASDHAVAKLGHLNFLIDQLNTNSDKSFSIVAFTSGFLTAGASLTLSDDGGSTSTGVIIPENDTCWAAEITVAAICKTAGGTVSLADTFMGKFNILIKRVANVTTIVGVNSASTTYDDSLSTASVSFTVGASGNIKINFIAPSTASNTEFKVSGTINVVQSSLK